MTQTITREVQMDPVTIAPTQPWVAPVPSNHSLSLAQRFLTDGEFREAEGRHMMEMDQPRHDASMVEEDTELRHRAVRRKDMSGNRALPPDSRDRIIEAVADASFQYWKIRDWEGANMPDNLL